MNTHIVVYESSHHQSLFPISRFRGVYDIPSGLFSLRELIGCFFPSAQIFFAHQTQREYLKSNPLSGQAATYAKAGQRSLSGKSLRLTAKTWQKGDRVVVIHSHWYDRKALRKLAEVIQPQVFADIQGVPLLASYEYGEEFSQSHWWQDLLSGLDPLPPQALPVESCLTALWQLPSLLSQYLISDADMIDNDQLMSVPLPAIIGPRQNIFIHRRTKIQPGVYLDARDGPIVIDRDASVTGPTLIQGPAYIGCGSQIDGAKIRPDCYIGHHCRIAGEVENSLILDYSNKHHDGFLGHSVIGSWVNWGSLANVSDLKNNYGSIRMWQLGQMVDTGLIKLGPVVGDFVKFAIGTQVNTATVVDCGGNLFGGNAMEKYYPPFCWGDASLRYAIEKFIPDSRKIMDRRRQQMTIELEVSLSDTFWATH